MATSGVNLSPGDKKTGLVNLVKIRTVIVVRCFQSEKLGTSAVCWYRASIYSSSVFVLLLFQLSNIFITIGLNFDCTSFFIFIRLVYQFV